MKTLSIDIETYSGTDLLSSGVYAYAEDPAFEVQLFGYAFDGGNVTVIDLEKGNVPQFVVRALTDPEITKTAYNANFERTCLSAWYGIDLLAEQWQDTMILAAELGLPRSLAEVGKVLGLPEDKQKMKEGKALVQYFSKPCKPTKANGGRTRNKPNDDPAKWAQYIEYNRQDVVTEMEIRKKLLAYSFSQSEQDLWAIDQNINDRGVMLDHQLAANAARIDAQIKEELQQEARELTSLDNPNSVVQVKKWIKEQTGIEVTSLERKYMTDVMSQVAGNEKVERFLELRRELGKTSTAKYKAMLACECEDHRIRGLTQFYGANRTGRWAGRYVQMQNLPQNKLPDDDLDYARQLVKAGDIKSFAMLYEPASTLSQLIRTAFIPKPGYKFIVSDFSAIEARVLAWIADEDWRIRVFNTHGKIYEASAEQMFHLPSGSVKKGDPMRQKGKIAELALGYGGSVGALIAMGALNMGLEEKELKPLVNSWRTANPHINKFWWNTDAAVKLLLRTKRPQRLPHGMAIRKEGPLMRLRLPSGRELSYVRPKLHPDDSITYEGIIQDRGGWGEIPTYGPKVVENIVQATARDCLAESMKRLEALGIPIVFHVHDEVICEVPEDSYTAQEIADIMGKPIDWAPGLPLRADAYECHYYKKD